jgi:arylsulfatase
VAPPQGKSLVPILDGSRAAVRSADDWLGWELFGNRAIRQGKWKLLWMCPPHGTGAWQLYDMDADPAERTDLSSAEPAIKQRLAGLWDDYVRLNNVVLPDRSPLCRPASAQPSVAP